MRCRRCKGVKLLKLDKRINGDNDVLRCRECGYIFSPAPTESRESAELRGMQSR